MAECKVCKAEISEDREYCNDCLGHRNSVAEESYLDSLLNSVSKQDALQMNNTNEINDIPELNEEDIENTYESEDLGDNRERENIENIEDNKNIEGIENIKGIENIEDIQDIEDVKSIEDIKVPDEIEEPDGTGRMREFEGIENLDASEDVKSFDDIDESLIFKDMEDFESLYNVENLTEFEGDSLEADVYSHDESGDDGYDSGEIQEEEQPYHPGTEDQDDNIDMEILQMLQDNEEESEQDEFEQLLGNLFNGFDDGGMDTGNAAEEKNEDLSEEEISFSDPLAVIAREMSENQEDQIENNMEDDILSLLGQFSPEDPIASELQDIGNLLQGKVPQIDAPTRAAPENVGEVFSDALTAVTTLADYEAEQAILSGIPDDLDTASKKKSKEKDKKEKKAKQIKQEEPKQKKKKTKPEKKKSGGLFALLFEDDETEETTDNQQVKEKKGKKKSVKKSAKIQPAGEEEDEVSVPASRKAAKQLRKDKSKEKKAKKKEKDQAIIDIIDEYEETAKINRLGASLIFVFFGVLVVLLLIVTNIFSYSLSIKNATTYFNQNEYTEAYNQVYGVHIKDEDIEIYDKIQTVMFVNKQLNSYNNYYGMQKYPEALDSLLKGLRRYDKYLELATMLGIKSDLDYVRNQILAELDREFDLTEKEAVSIINLDSEMKYSVAVYDIIRESGKAEK